MGCEHVYRAMRRILATVDRMVERRELRYERKQKWRELLPKDLRTPSKKEPAMNVIEKQLRLQPLPLSERKCPECREPFVTITVGDLLLETCLPCGSFWLDVGELKSLTHWPEDVPAEKRVSDPSRFLCPVCGEPMHEHIFLSPYELRVDKCVNGHGVYMEHGELRKALELQ